MQGVLECASGLLQSNYRAQGQQALNHQQSALQQLLSQVSHITARRRTDGELKRNTAAAHSLTAT